MVTVLSARDIKRRYWLAEACAGYDNGAAGVGDIRGWKLRHVKQGL